MVDLRGNEVPSGGGRSAFAITPNDSTDLATAARAVYVGGSGDIRVQDLDGNDITLSGAVAGSTIPLAVKRVYSTNTTATNLVGFT